MDEIYIGQEMSILDAMKQLDKSSKKYCLYMKMENSWLLLRMAISADGY